jgi:DNA-binding GntR family transcriptional regulator
LIEQQTAPTASPWPGVPRRTLLADDTYHILREALISNQLRPGQRLNIEQLAQDLNVSITPIRYALVQLAADGFVTREPYKGYIASALLDRATVAEIFEARIMIETQLVGISAKLATPVDVAFLNRMARLDPTAKFVDEDELTVNVDGELSCDAALHRRIAQIAGNNTMVDILDGLNKRMLAYRSFKNQRAQPDAQWNPTQQGLAATKREHRAIVRAIKDREPEQAREAMRVHLENASQRDIDPVPGPLAR